MAKHQKTIDKTNPTIDRSGVKKVLKYHFQLFIFTIFAVVGFMIFNVYQILNAPTDEGYYQSKKADITTNLDPESVRAINRLYFSDEVKEQPSNPEDIAETQ